MIPQIYFTGRAPLEAAAQGIRLGPNDCAIRCNLVTIENQTMRDFTAGHISTAEATELLATLSERLAIPGLEFIPGVSYRNLLIYRGGDTPPPFTADTRATPPHDLTDKSVLDDYPRGPASDLLNQLMSDSVAIFADHPVNVERRRRGESPATNVWLWGQGRTPAVPPFAQVYGKTGAMITAVDLLRGLAALLGWRQIDVPGATGYLDTDYAAKGRARWRPSTTSISSASTSRRPTRRRTKGTRRPRSARSRRSTGTSWLRCITALAAQGDYRILVSPDHPTPLRTKTHSHGAVPFTIAGTGVVPDGLRTYDEHSAAESKLAFDEGWKLMRLFSRGVNCPIVWRPIRGLFLLRVS